MKPVKGLIIVTGGSKGIGRAIIERFAKEGYPIATCSRSRENLDTLQTHIWQQYQTKLIGHVADLSDATQAEAFAECVLLEKTPVAALIHNAAIFRSGRLLDEEPQEFWQLMQLNLMAAHVINRKIVPHMLIRQSGHIFFIGSVASVRGFPDCGAYTVSKHALLGMARALREELKPEGIRVTTLLPGATYTDSWSGSQINPDRLMPASDIAELVWSCFSLSARSVVEELVLRPQAGDL